MRTLTFVKVGSLIIILLLATTMISGCAPLPKVWTPDGQAHNEQPVLSRGESVVGRAGNVSSQYKITFYTPSGIAFELGPGEYTQKFEAFSTGLNHPIKCHIARYRNGHGLVPSQYAEEDILYPLDFSKGNAPDPVRPDSTLDFLWLWPGPGGVANEAGR